jgi:hypothetical protein
MIMSLIHKARQQMINEMFVFPGKVSFVHNHVNNIAQPFVIAYTLGCYNFQNLVIRRIYAHHLINIH